MEEALMDAVWEGNIEMVEHLLNTGTDPNSHGGRVLIQAVEDNNIEMVRLLLDAGANPNSMYLYAYEHGHEHIIDTLSSTENLRIVALLLARGADPNLNQSNALTHAARVGNLAMVKLLIGRGAKDLDKILSQAVRYNRPVITMYLLSLGTRPYKELSGSVVSSDYDFDAARILIDTFPESLIDSRTVGYILDDSVLSRLIVGYL